jgi:membrane protease YdiL (CAAX protease family)
LRLLDLSWSKVREHSAEIGKYAVICVFSITLLTLLIPVAELDIARMSFEMSLLAFFSTVIAAPILEETIFRGYLYTAMIPQFNRERDRLVVNAMLFSMVHVPFYLLILDPFAVPFYIFIIGYFLAKLYERSRSVLPGIVLHTINNGFVFFLEAIEFHRMVGGDTFMQ